MTGAGAGRLELRGGVNIQNTVFIFSAAIQRTKLALSDDNRYILCYVSCNVHCTLIAVDDWSVA